MRLLIHDANVLIDLLDLGLLDLALTLPYAMETTDLVRLEVQTPDQERALSRCVTSGRLSVLSSSSRQILDIRTIHSEHPRLSLADCSVLYHALDRDGIVLSGDGRLRHETEALHLEVHGTPWILEKMVEHRVLDPQGAINKLTYLMSLNKRLPHKECDRLMETWKRRTGNR
mgnify:CR=1 FL=1